MQRTLFGSLVIAGSVMCGLAFADDGHARTYQTTDLFKVGVPSMKLQGAATLIRSRRSLEMRIAASHLDPNSAYTVWWVIFNRPGACVGGCGPTALANPATRASVFYAAGFVTGDDGTGNISAHVEGGVLPTGLDVEPDGTVAGLDGGNGLAAEVHLVIRAHGPVIAGLAHAQLGSFNGACPPNTCANQQAAVFAPGAAHDDEER